MKQIIAICLLSGISFNSISQLISIEKIKAIPQKSFYNTKDSTLVFPAFKIKNKNAEIKINNKIKTDFKKDRGIEKSGNIQSMLKKASEEGLTQIDFEIKYQKNKLLSFLFQWEATGAYSSTWQTYYCFNLETGNLITLDSLIDKRYKKDFLSLVKKKQSENINKYKKDLSDQLRKKEIDKETFNWATAQIRNNSWGNYNPQNFIIDKNTLTIIIDCEFPHAIQALSPDNEIKLTIKEVQPYFNSIYL